LTSTESLKDSRAILFDVNSGYEVRSARWRSGSPASSEAGAARPEIPGVLLTLCVNAEQNARIELEEETVDQITIVP